MGPTKWQGPARRAGLVVKTVSLILLLVIGACAMAVGVGSAGQTWSACFSVVPLFLVIRLCRPVGAMLGGALWGVSLGVFSIAGPAAIVSPSIQSLLLLAVAPALYAYLGSRLTRWIGFHAFVLGVGWMGVELAFAPAGLSTGQLGDAVGGGTITHWVGKTLGCVLLAFIVALVGASVVGVLSSVRWSFPPLARRIPSDGSESALSSQTFFCVRPFAIGPSRPRAPPIPLDAV